MIGSSEDGGEGVCGGCVSDSGDRAGGEVGNKQTPHHHTYRRLNVGVVNLFSFTMISQSTLEFPFFFPVSGEGKCPFWPLIRGKKPTFSKHVADNSCDKFPNAAFIKEAIYILISFVVFVKVCGSLECGASFYANMKSIIYIKRRKASDCCP